MVNTKTPTTWDQFVLQEMRTPGDRGLSAPRPEIPIFVDPVLNQGQDPRPSNVNTLEPDVSSQFPGYLQQFTPGMQGAVTQEYLTNGKDSALALALWYASGMYEHDRQAIANRGMAAIDENRDTTGDSFIRSLPFVGGHLAETINPSPEWALNSFLPEKPQYPLQQMAQGGFNLPTFDQQPKSLVELGIQGISQMAYPGAAPAPRVTEYVPTDKYSIDQAAQQQMDTDLYIAGIKNTYTPEELDAEIINQQQLQQVNSSTVIYLNTYVNENMIDGDSVGASQQLALALSEDKAEANTANIAIDELADAVVEQAKQQGVTLTRQEARSFLFTTLTPNEIIAAVKEQGIYHSRTGQGLDYANGLVYPELSRSERAIEGVGNALSYLSNNVGKPLGGWLAYQQSQHPWLAAIEQGVTSAATGGSAGIWRMLSNEFPESELVQIMAMVGNPASLGSVSAAAGSLSKEEIEQQRKQGGYRGVWEGTVAGYADREYEGMPLARGIYLGGKDILWDPVTWISIGAGASLPALAEARVAAEAAGNLSAVRKIDALTAAVRAADIAANPPDYLLKGAKYVPQTLAQKLGTPEVSRALSGIGSASRLPNPFALTDEAVQTNVLRDAMPLLDNKATGGRLLTSVDEVAREMAAERAAAAAADRASGITPPPPAIDSPLPSGFTLDNGAELPQVAPGQTTLPGIQEPDRITADANRLLDQAADTAPVDDIFDPNNGIGSVPLNMDVDYRGFTKRMTPDEFHSLAVTGRSSPSSSSYLAERVRNGEKLGNPWLDAIWDDELKVWVVSGHEGRSRSDVVARLYGQVDMPVHIFPGNGIRARDLTDEMLNARFISQRDYGKWLRIKEGPGDLGPQEWEDLLNSINLISIPGRTAAIRAPEIPVTTITGEIEDPIQSATLGVADAAVQATDPARQLAGNAPDEPLRYPGFQGNKQQHGQAIKDGQSDVFQWRDDPDSNRIVDLPGKNHADEPAKVNSFHDEVQAIKGRLLNHPEYKSVKEGGEEFRTMREKILRQKMRDIEVTVRNVVEPYLTRWDDLDPMSLIAESRIATPSESGRASWVYENTAYLMERYVATPDAREADSILRVLESSGEQAARQGKSAGGLAGATYKDEITRRLRDARMEYQDLLERYPHMAPDGGVTVPGSGTTRPRGITPAAAEQVTTPAVPGDQAFTPASPDVAQADPGITPADASVTQAEPPIAPGLADTTNPRSTMGVRELMSDVRREKLANRAMIEDAASRNVNGEAGRGRVSNADFGGDYRALPRSLNEDISGRVIQRMVDNGYIDNGQRELLEKTVGKNGKTVLDVAYDAYLKNPSDPAKAMRALYIEMADNKAARSYIASVKGYKFLSELDRELASWASNNMQYNALAGRAMVQDRTYDAAIEATMGDKKSAYLGFKYWLRDAWKAARGKTSPIYERVVNDAEAAGLGSHQLHGLSSERFGTGRGTAPLDSFADQLEIGANDTPLTRFSKGIGQPNIAKALGFTQSQMLKNARQFGDRIARAVTYSTSAYTAAEERIPALINEAKRLAGRYNMSESEAETAVKGAIRKTGDGYFYVDVATLENAFPGGGSGGTEVVRFWRQQLRESRSIANGATNALKFSYNQRVIDKWASKIFFFPYWTSRATIMQGRMMVENPIIRSAYFNIWNGMHNAAEKNNAPDWMKIYLQFQMGPLGMIGLVNPSVVAVPMAMALDAWGVEADDPTLNKILSIAGLPMKPLPAIAAMTLGARKPGDITGLAPLQVVAQHFVDFAAEMGVTNPTLQAYAQFGTNAQQRIFGKLNQMAFEASRGVPGFDGLVKEDNSKSLAETRQQNIMATMYEIAADQGITKDTPEGRAKIEQAELDIIQGRFDRGLAQEAFGLYADRNIAGDAARQGIGLTTGLNVSLYPQQRADQQVLMQESSRRTGLGLPSTPEEQEAYDQSGMQNAGSVDSAILMQESEGYQRLGDETSGDATYTAYNAIAYGTDEQRLVDALIANDGNERYGFRIVVDDRMVIPGVEPGKSTFLSPAELMTLDPDTRRAVAGAWVDSSPERQQAMEDQRTARQDFKDSSQMYGDYSEYRNAATSWPEGPVDFVQHIIDQQEQAGNPGTFAAWYADNVDEETRNDPNLLLDAVTTEEAYAAATGLDWKITDSPRFSTEGMTGVPQLTGAEVSQRWETGSPQMTLYSELTTYREQYGVWMGHVLYQTEGMPFSELTPQTQEYLTDYLASYGIMKPSVSKSLGNYFDWRNGIGSQYSSEIQAIDAYFGVTVQPAVDPLAPDQQDS